MLRLNSYEKTLQKLILRNISAECARNLRPVNGSDNRRKSVVQKVQTVAVFLPNKKGMRKSENIHLLKD
jgi:hypothetical protein